MARVVCIVQARTGSTRLPGKVLLPLNGHTVIEEVLARCKRIKGIDEVALAIPNNWENDILADIPHAAIFRGSEHDVLGRYADCVKVFPADVVMRITGDCPLLCPELCHDVLNLFFEAEAEYACNNDPPTFPKGFDCEVFTVDLLQQCDRIANGSYAREHVTPLMREAKHVRRVNLASPWRMEGRCVLDTWEDYLVICAALGCEPGKRVRAAGSAQIAV